MPVSGSSDYGCFYEAGLQKGEAIPELGLQAKASISVYRCCCEGGARGAEAVAYIVVKRD